MKVDRSAHSPQAGDAREHARWNERMVQKYDPDAYHQHQNPVIRWIEARRVGEVMRHIPGENDPRILEVGCGGGNVLDRVPAKRLYGMDLSRFILYKAKERLGNRASLLCGAAERLPFRDGAFDCVFCTEVIEHTLDPSVIMGEMLRMLRPGGVLILSVPNEGLIDRLKRLISRLGFYRLFFTSGDFASPVDNEWHLHDFDRKFLTQVIGPNLEGARIIAIPFFILPLRFVAVGYKHK